MADPDSQSFQHFELEFPPDVEYLFIPRRVFAALTQLTGLAGLEAERFVMAIDEACAYAVAGMNRRNPAPHRRTIRLEVQIHPSSIQVVLLDGASDFSGQFHRKVQIDEPRERFRSQGLAIQLIKLFMDEATHEFLPGEGNRLTMVKKFDQFPQ